MTTTTPKWDSPTDEIEDSGGTGEIESFEIEFIPIDTTKKFIETLRERWWNFVGRILDGTDAATEQQAHKQRVMDSVIPSQPLFTGLRVALGGDRHTH